jgi:NADH dehydrogenase FAD-containing subunit
MNQKSNPTLILGGGFVGLFTALHLSRQNYQQPIVLIEQRDRFSFKPLLYELLSGELKPQQVPVMPTYSPNRESPLSRTLLNRSICAASRLP